MSANIWEIIFQCAIGYCQQNISKSALYKQLDALFQKTDINAKNSTGQTYLVAACFAPNRKLIEYLLNKGADPNIADNNFDTPLLILVSEQFLTAFALFIPVLKEDEIIDILTLLVDKGALVNYEHPSKQTVLAIAADNNNLPLTRLLLKLGADPNHIIEGSPLFESLVIRYLKEENTSLKKIQLKILEACLKKGITNHDVLLVIIYKEDLQLLKLCIDYKMDPHAPFMTAKKETTNCLAFAIAAYNVAAVEFLLEQKNISGLRQTDETAYLRNFAITFLKSNQTPTEMQNSLKIIELMLTHTKGHQDICQAILHVGHPDRITHYALKIKELLLLVRKLVPNLNDLVFSGLPFLSMVLVSSNSVLVNILFNKNNKFGFDLNYILYQDRENNPILCLLKEKNYPILQCLFDNDITFQQLKKWEWRNADLTHVLGKIESTEKEPFFLKEKNKFAEIMKASKPDTFNALHAFAFENHLASLAIFVEAFSLPINQGREGIIPLHIACDRGHIEIVKYLLARPDIDLLAPGPKQLYCWDIALFRDHYEIFRLLMLKQFGETEENKRFIELCISLHKSGSDISIQPPTPHKKENDPIFKDQQSTFFQPLPEASQNFSVISAHKYCKEKGITIKKLTEKPQPILQIDFEKKSPQPTYSWFGSLLTSNMKAEVRPVEGQLDTCFCYIDSSLFEAKNCDQNFLKRVLNTPMKLAGLKGDQGLVKFEDIPCTVHYLHSDQKSIKSVVNREIKLLGEEKRLLCCQIQSDCGKAVLYVAVKYLSDGFHSRVKPSDFTNTTFVIQLPPQKEKSQKVENVDREQFLKFK